ncbi:MAG: membrane dipeptidase [Patescibacteria group bacterium]|nr:membrane dipeptidase [Patescibacteria group bacterium]
MSERGREGLSSLHDDVHMPWQGRELPEYSNHPKRHPDVGERGERSVLQRLYQFGVTEGDLAEMGLAGLLEMTAEQYETLIGRAVVRQSELIFANAFDMWQTARPEQMAPILETARMVERWRDEWGIKLVRRGTDVTESGPMALVSLEGFNLIEDIDEPAPADVDRVLDQVIGAGVRSIALQYGRATKLATMEQGLTPLGRYAVTGLLEKGMIVDLAHSLPQTRLDTLNLAEDSGRGPQIAYTHGAPTAEIAKNQGFEQIAVGRGLTEDEIKRVMRLGGIIGLGVSRPFFHSPEHVAETIHRLAQMEHGPHQLALGTDFGGVPPGFTLEGLGTPAEVAGKLGDLLVGRYGVPEAAVKGILSRNAKDWVRSSLKT